MKLALELLGIVSLIELCIWLPGVWRLRKLLATICIITLAGISGAIVCLHVTVWSCLLFVISIYRILNLLRIVENRMHEQYLHRSASRTSIILITCQLVILAIWLSINHWQLRASLGWTTLATLQLLGAAILCYSTFQSIRATRAPLLRENRADRDLPTVTVAVPARNETAALEACLKSIVSSDYPKLEILVLDDCSHDRTPEIIRSFAHDGIRFIGGEEPQTDWLAKNQAYQRLYEESSGELILFCGVDVRLEPGSIRALVDTMLGERKTMLSIMPSNLVPKPFSQHESLLVQPMRYAWELSLPRRLFNRPPALGTCWIVERKIIKQGGSFASVSRDINPQRHFARIASKHDGYSFLRSDKQLAVSSTKGFDEQRATAIRKRYPEVHRRPEQVLLIALSEFIFLCAPFILLITAWAMGAWWLVGISAAGCILLEIFYILIVKLTYRRFLWRSLIALPFAAIFNIGLINLSMWRYEFAEVIWKGRNVCLPMMHVVPHLPKV